MGIILGYKVIREKAGHVKGLLRVGKYVHIKSKNITKFF